MSRAVFYVILVAMNTETITVPRKALEEMLQASAYFERAQDELENYLLSKNKHFLAEMKKLQREEKQSKPGSWESLKTKYGVSSSSATKI